jgi:L-serine dehydratase
MRAAALFTRDLGALQPERIKVELFGSLGLTGLGHGTHYAVMSGLEGKQPETIDPSELQSAYDHAKSRGTLRLPTGNSIPFNLRKDLIFNKRKSLSHHPNGLTIAAFGPERLELFKRTLYSLGGGFIIDEKEISKEKPVVPVPYPFKTAGELIQFAEEIGISVSALMLDNEKTWRPRTETVAGLDKVWATMQACVQKGLNTEGTLPGGLKIQRRAPGLYRKLCDRPESALRDALTILDWVDVYAIAVNEENAAGGRVVTAPTNGAAGIIPAVMHYCDRFLNGLSPDWHRNFLLTAGAIGLLFKENASISGADVGCQGEVGVACSMAAGALAEIMGGSPKQVENAAEIGMEHNLGLTCDPISGLVQIPCIERNAMGAVKAINAARIALRGDGQHSVSLDAVIRTMRETGKDMRRKYKETSTGGLAVNVVEC